MGTTIIHPLEDKCEACGKCVEVSIIPDSIAPSFTSERSKQDCPINIRHKAGPRDKVDIYFVPCD
jgi:hypothetical protein